MFRQVIQCKQKNKVKMAHMGSTLCEFDKWNYQVLINIKK